MTFAEKPHLLVVDDDDRIRTLLFRYLTQAGYVVAMASSADEARAVLDTLVVDLIVLDIMMPGMNGVEFTRALRAAGVRTPILLLTAMGEVTDRIAGLEAGADDYLTKPFEPRELDLRISAILRRMPAARSAVARFRLGPWEIDLDREEMVDREVDDGPQKLTSVEIKLLRALSGAAGQVMGREALAIACGVNPDERTIDVQMTRLRRKLNDDPRTPRFIATVRGQGYQMMVQEYSVV